MVDAALPPNIDHSPSVVRSRSAIVVVAIAGLIQPKSPFGNYGWASLRIINPPIAISIMASETSILAS